MHPSSISNHASSDAQLIPHSLHRFTEHPMPKDKRLMPTFQTKQRNTSGTQRRHKHAQPSPDPRLAARAAEVGSLFDRPVAPRVR